MIFFSNERIKKFLESFFREKPLEIQSLLFSGEKDLGKMTTALNFSKALLCLNQKKWGGCNNCESCKLFDLNLHPDLKIIETKGDNISIDEIKGKEEENKEGAIQFLSYYPQISPLKIIIINEAEKLTYEAQNAFLKTLEEPPKNSLIILVSSQPEKLLLTVRSRVINLKFKPAFKEKIAKYLQKEFLVEETKAFRIAKESRGKIGLAIKLLDKNYLKEREEIFKEFINLSNKSFIFKSNYLDEKIKSLEENENSNERKKTNKIREMIELWLEKLEKEIKGEEKEILITNEKKLKLIRELLAAYDLISSSNINSQLLLENIFLNI